MPQLKAEQLPPYLLHTLWHAWPLIWVAQSCREPRHFNSVHVTPTKMCLCALGIGIMCSENGCTRFSSIWYIHCRPYSGTLKLVPWLLHCNDSSRSHSLISFMPQLKAEQLQLKGFRTLWHGHWGGGPITKAFQLCSCHTNENVFARTRHWYDVWRVWPRVSFIFLMYSLPILYWPYETSYRLLICDVPTQCNVSSGSCFLIS